MYSGEATQALKIPRVMCEQRDQTHVESSASSIRSVQDLELGLRYECFI